jgi:CDP-diacylglycerol--glycerol-3-phosphate 3-phosphatidyltransferase
VNPHWPWSGPAGDVAFIMGFIAFFALPFLFHIGLLSVGASKLPVWKESGAGRRLLGPMLIGYYYWLLSPVFRFVSRTRLKPNQITLASLGAAALTALAIGTGHFALASTLLIAGATLDVIDGQLARSKQMTTVSGAFLDSTIDRICDGFIFGGCVVYYAGTPIMYVSLLVLVMSFTVSYARSRAETLGIVGVEGLMQRADRLTILGIALAFSPVFGHSAEGFIAHPFYGITAGALCLLAVLNTVTAAARIKWTMERLKESTHLSLVRPRSELARIEVLREAVNDATTLANQQAR